uniref:BHLH transcription factor bHLH3.9 n=1 Tax=Gardenia jasminoides TaxID=114476 RepID=A0A6M4C8I7_GARJA|nr:bHLH transcription factor bHLH3.9 [Gardenia jasminoides]
MDHVLSDQCSITDSIVDGLFGACGDDLHNCLSTKGNSSISPIIATNNSTSRICVSAVIEAPPIVTGRPTQQQNPNGYNWSTIHNFPSFDQPSSSPMLLTFGALNPGDDKVCDVLTSNGSFNSKKGKENWGRTRSPSKTYDHIIAERKRREYLGQLFLSLSSILPGLKKMDKTSALGDAINHLKHLQEKVKTLEERVTKQTVESVVLVKKSQLLVEDERGCKNNNQLLFPQIEAKVCDKEVLLRVNCENKRGVLIRILSEVEKLNLAVISTSVTPFGNLTLEVMITAEMEKEFNMTTKDLAKNLGSLFNLL